MIYLLVYIIRILDYTATSTLHYYASIYRIILVRKYFEIEHDDISIIIILNSYIQQFMFYIEGERAHAHTHREWERKINCSISANNGHPPSFEKKKNIRGHYVIIKIIFNLIRYIILLYTHEYMVEPRRLRMTGRPSKRDYVSFQNISATYCFVRI